MPFCMVASSDVMVKKYFISYQDFEDLFFTLNNIRWKSSKFSAKRKRSKFLLVSPQKQREQKIKKRSE
jgi:hypothetical protein